MSQISEEFLKYADVITTGFFRGQGLVVGCLKNRDRAMFAPFLIEPDMVHPTLWDYLTQEP
jgi:hypothetical protein